MTGSSSRGYFGIGAEGLSKAMNAGSLFRTAHAFGASFVFTVGAVFDRNELERADTARSANQLPYYEFPSLEAMTLPRECALVGIELSDEAVELPSFRHPRKAAYVLGPERGSLSAEMTACCDFVIKIPTAFCVNVALAGGIVMYDRLITLGRFPLRPVLPGQKPSPLPAHTQGAPVLRRARKTSPSRKKTKR